MTLLILAGVTKAQTDKVNAAIAFLQKGNLDSAKITIDAAISDSHTAASGQVWYYRGFIYKTVYNKTEKANKQSPARIEALNSFKKSLSLDTSVENIQENINNIKYLATSLYNDAAASLDSVDYKIAIEDFDKFKEYYLLIDPSTANFKTKRH